MSITLKVNNVDVSAWLAACDPVPVIYRNRDWTFGIPQFKLELSDALAFTPANDQAVELIVNSSPCYIGYIGHYKYNYNSCRHEVTVYNYMQKLEKKLITYEDIHAFLAHTSLSAGVAFTVDTVNEYVVKTAHGLSDGDFIYCVPDAGSTLPAGIIPYKHYQVRAVNADSLHLYEGEISVTTSYVDITDSGTGTFKYYIPDRSKYCFIDTATAISSINVQLKWLLIKLFEVSGMQLDTTAIDSIILYKNNISGTDYSYTIADIAFDENMLYCINQQKAIKHEVIDANETDVNYNNSKITLLQFLQDICGKLGFAVRYVGPYANKTFKLYSQYRDADGIINVTLEALHTIANNDKYNYQSEVLDPESGGYQVSRLMGSGRTIYYDDTEWDLTETDKFSVDNGGTTISWYRSLRFFLRDKRAGAGTGWILSDWSYELFNELNYSAIVNEINTKIFRHRREDITAPIQTIIPQIKEHYIDVEYGHSIIVQELNLLTS